MFRPDDFFPTVYQPPASAYDEIPDPPHVSIAWWLLPAAALALSALTIVTHIFQGAIP